jgi:hypothetical protein
MRPEGLSIKYFSDSIGNRTRDLSVCSAVPQSTAPPRTTVKMSTTCLVSESFVLLDCYTAQTGSYRGFGSTYMPYFQGSSSLNRLSRNVDNYQYALSYNPEGRRSHLHRGVSLKSCIFTFSST